MKKYLLAALIGSLSTAAGAVCQYPLDATSTQYAQFGAQPYPAINLQSASFTSFLTMNPDGSIGGQFYTALSNGGAQALYDSNVLGSNAAGGDIALPTSGIEAVEISIDHFPPVSTSTSNLGLTLEFVSSNIGSTTTDSFGLAFLLEATSFTAPNYFAKVKAYRVGSGQYSDVMTDLTSLPQPLPAGFRLGLYLNMTTRQVGYTVNGVDHGYVTNPDGSAFTIPAGVQSGLLASLGLNQVLNSADSNLGQTVGFTLITDRSQFTQPFPAGTNDICSANGGNGVLLPNGKPYPGKGNPPGLLKRQSLLNGGATGPLLKVTP